jgi:hypothetical protein
MNDSPTTVTTTCTIVLFFNKGLLTQGEMTAKVVEEVMGWLKRYIDNTEQRKMPKAVALKALENAVGIVKRVPAVHTSHIITLTRKSPLCSQSSPSSRLPIS